MQAIGFAVVCLYVFLLFSRVHDYVYYLRLPMLLLSLGMVMVVASGHLATTMRSRIGLLLLVLTGWMIAGIPFSVWPGGALNTMNNIWLRSMGVFFMTATLVTGVKQVRRVMGSVALGMSIGSILVLRMGEEQYHGRLAGEFSRFSDSNDLAQLLLVGACMAFGVVAHPRLAKPARFIFLMGGLLMVLTFMRSGSRGGFIGFLVVLLCWFLAASAAGKLQAVLLGTVALVVGMLVLPAQVRNRYLSLFGVQAETFTTAEEVAEGSATARTYLFKQSLRMTAQKPIFGVGLGMFEIAENGLAQDQGLRKGAWHQTHNMYTQVSSETGLPGFFCFGGALFIAFRSLNQITRSRKKVVGRLSTNLEDLIHAATWIRLALIAFCSTGMFLSTAYTAELIGLLGLVFALDRAAQLEFRAMAAASVAPPIQSQPVPAVPAAGLPNWMPASQTRPLPGLRWRG